MCGFFTYIGSEAIDLKIVTDEIQHRGPDADGYLIANCSDWSYRRQAGAANTIGSKVAFGFRRLAIIDLQEAANQPFSSDDGKYHIVFNGEIYNYLELRQELEKEGILLGAFHAFARN